MSSAASRPARAARTHLGLPVFNTVKEAVARDRRQARITFVAPAFCADAIMEAADAGIRLICSITDGIPAQDMMRVKRYLLRYPEGPPSDAGRPQLRRHHQPGKAMLGIMPGHIYTQGHVGIVSRSGTLGYEAASQMKAAGHRHLDLASASAATRSTAGPSSITSCSSRRTRRPKPC